MFERLLASTFSFETLAAAQDLQRPNIMDEKIWGNGDGGSYSASGVSVTQDNSLQLDVVQGCLEALSGPLSSLPMGVLKKAGEDRQPAPEHPVAKLLKRPNDRQTSQEFRDEMARHLAFWRNFYARILPDGDAPIGSLEIIHPKRVKKVERLESGRIRYTVQPLTQPAQDEIYLDDEIWHIRKAPLTDDGLQGRPIFDTAKEVLGRAIAVKEYGSRFFANSGRSGGVLKHPGTFKSKEDKDNFLETWRSSGTGKNAHKDRMLLYGIDYMPLDVQNDEAQFTETISAEAVAVCRLWNMPPHRVGILDRATFSNIEQQSIEFVVYTLAPWIAAIEQAAARDLLIGDDQDKYVIEFNVAGLLRGDIAARYAAYAVGRQWGWLSVNDICKLENRNGIGPEGDIYLQPMNMVKAGEPTPVKPQLTPDPIAPTGTPSPGDKNAP